MINFIQIINGTCFFFFVCVCVCVCVEKFQGIPPHLRNCSGFTSPYCYDRLYLSL